MYANNQQANAHQMAALDGGTGWIRGGSMPASTAGTLGGVDKRVPELPAALDTMERTAGYLNEIVNEMETRLEGVVRPAAPEPAGSQQIGKAPPVSGFASAIHGQAARVTSLADRLQDLLRRLEV